MDSAILPRPTQQPLSSHHLKWLERRWGPAGWLETASVRMPLPETLQCLLCIQLAIEGSVCVCVCVCVCERAHTQGAPGKVREEGHKYQLLEENLP